MEIFKHDGWRAVRWITSIFASNVYLIVPEAGSEAAVIDAGGAARNVASYCRKNSLELKYIILTHRHLDHAIAASRMRRATGATVLAGRLDSRSKKAFSDGGGSLEDKDRIELGPLSIQIVTTPGHTPGGISLSIKEALFTGDTLFANGIGRTDFKGGDYQAMLNSLKRLFTFPEKTAVYPGHGPPTTIGREIRGHNPIFS